MDSHPERFAGLHIVARALIGYLATAYDVEVHEDPVHRDLLIEVLDVLHAVRVTPRGSGAAPLTFVLTGYPGVVVHAGVLHDSRFPCAAATRATKRLRQQRTGWSGWCSRSRPADTPNATRLAAGGGANTHSARSTARARKAAVANPAPSPPPGLHEAEIRLREVDGPWRPWPLRGS